MHGPCEHDLAVLPTWVVCATLYLLKAVGDSACMQYYFLGVQWREPLIENYTYQLTSFKHKLKNFIYINANITNEEMENNQNQTVVNASDASALKNMSTD